MKQLIFRRHKGRSGAIPYVLVSDSGRIGLSRACRDLLDVKPGSFVNFTEDEDGDIYISKAYQGEGYVLREHKGSVGFHNSSLKAYLVDALDLAVGKDRMKNVAVDLVRQSKCINNIYYYKLNAE